MSQQSKPSMVESVLNTVGLGHRTTDPTAPSVTGVNSQTAVAGQNYPHGTNTIGGTDTYTGTGHTATHPTTFEKVKDAITPGHDSTYTGQGHSTIGDSTYNTSGVNTHGVNTHESTFEKVKDAVLPGQHSRAHTGGHETGGVGHIHDGQHAHTGHAVHGHAKSGDSTYNTHGVNTHESTFEKVKNAVLPGQDSHAHTGVGHAHDGQHLHTGHTVHDLSGVGDNNFNTGVNTHSGIGETGIVHDPNTASILARAAADVAPDLHGHTGHSGHGHSGINTHVDTHDSTFEKVKDAVPPGQQSHAHTGHEQTGIEAVGHAHDGQHAHTGHRDASLLEKGKDDVTPAHQSYAHTGVGHTHDTGYAGAGPVGSLGAVAGSQEIGHHRHGVDTLSPTEYGKTGKYNTGVTGLGTATTHTTTGTTAGVAHPSMMEKVKDSLQNVKDKLHIQK